MANLFHWFAAYIFIYVLLNWFTLQSHFGDHENTQGIMSGPQSNVICGVDEVAGVVGPARCSEICSAEVLSSIPTWSTSRRVSSTPSKQQHICSWWHCRVLFSETDQILCYSTPSITCSFNPKAQPLDVTLNCNNLFTSSSSFLGPSAMSTKLHSITSQKITILIRPCELQPSIVVCVYITTFLPKSRVPCSYPQ